MSCTEWRKRERGQENSKCKLLETGAWLVFLHGPRARKAQNWGQGRRSVQRGKWQCEAITRTLGFIQIWEATDVLHKVSCYGFWAENRLNWLRVEI